MAQGHNAEERLLPHLAATQQEDIMSQGRRIVELPFMSVRCDSLSRDQT